MRQNSNDAKKKNSSNFGLKSAGMTPYLTNPFLEEESCKLEEITHPLILNEDIFLPTYRDDYVGFNKQWQKLIIISIILIFKFQ